MQKNSIDKELNDPGSSFLDKGDFVPIDPNWRKKYYRRILKKRVYAFLLDIFFNSAIFLVVGFLFIVFFSTVLVATHPKWQNAEIDTFLNNYGDYVTLLTFSVICLPLAIMESSKWKGTLGKRKMKIQITDNYGQAISFWRSLLRNILKALVLYSYFFIIPAIIQYITFKKTRKLFHDEFSNTIIGERL